MALRYGDAAVVALLDTMTADLVASLRSVETELGLDADSLTDPIEIEAAELAQDNRSPLIQIFSTSETPENEPRNAVWDIEVVCALTYTGVPDKAVNDRFLGAYVQAMEEVIEDDPLLQGKAIAARVRSVDSGSIGDSSQVRSVRALTVDVQVYTPAVA